MKHSTQSALYGISLLIIVLIIGVSVYAFTAPKGELVNPNGEQVFTDQDGKVIMVGEPELGLADSDFVDYASDVIGTKNGTTTTGVAFGITGGGGNTATSSYVSKIGNRDLAIYTIKVLKASSSANAVFDVQGSNDDYCSDAVATSTSDVLYTEDLPLLSEINWFSAGDHFKNKVHSTSFDNASSTSILLWTDPMQYASNEIILTDLNYRCLRLNVSASSTVLWAQIRTK